MSPTRPIKDIPDLLADLDEHIVSSTEAIKAERRARRWWVILLLAAVVVTATALAAVALLFFDARATTERNRNISRCAIRATSHADHQATLRVLRRTVGDNENGRAFVDDLAAEYEAQEFELARTLPADC